MAWSTFKTEGIVLSSTPVREADRRYRILTEDRGKIEVIGRGARKGKAKLAAHLEPFAIVEVEVVRGRQQSTVIGVERKEWFTGIHHSFDRRYTASLMLGFVDRATREEDRDEQLYQELRNWLRFVNDTPAELRPLRATYVSGGFLLRLLGHVGYALELSTCLSCREEILPLSFRWHHSRGGLVCTDCVQTKGADWETASPMQEETVKMLRFARQASYDELLKPSLESTGVMEFARCVHDMYSIHVPGDWVMPFWQMSALETVRV